ncbi:hypothetical protein Nepgr_016712 [Nepenthes gracilis]|uniref:Uncharacterized protein n=1 Tax=Nepenthes gracilis TaxID=150966 RepID=A0AAD3SR47_NEPGR|nr:hypothetical protein Nepgr_016712 [Nepenthes gracilis]
MGRAPCCDKANVKKGPWSPEEDAKLKAYIEQYGTGNNWIALPQKIGLKRCGKSCRLRWLNYLRPNIKHGGFSEDEEDIICSLYISIGSRWSIIAAQLPGRTDNDIKNYWNTRLKKKLIAKQRKEQAARSASLLHQEMKAHRDYFMANQTMNQLSPYCPDQQTIAMPMTMGGSQDVLLEEDQHLDRAYQLANCDNNFQYHCFSQDRISCMNSFTNNSATDACAQCPDPQYYSGGLEELICSEIQSGMWSYAGVEMAGSSAAIAAADRTSWGGVTSLVYNPVI